MELRISGCSLWVSPSDPRITPGLSSLKPLQHASTDVDWTGKNLSIQLRDLRVLGGYLKVKFVKVYAADPKPQRAKSSQRASHLRQSGNPTPWTLNLAYPSSLPFLINSYIGPTPTPP